MAPRSAFGAALCGGPSPDTQAPVDLPCLARGPAPWPGAACKARQRTGGAGSAASAGRRWQHARGFTLIEVLVALAIMAVLAGLAWRGIDGMLRSRDISQQAVERTARVNTILAQWEQDLMALYDSGVVPPLAFDGQTLLLTRTMGDDGVSLVAWSLRGGAWLRWAAPPVTRSTGLQEAWLRSQQLLGTEPEQLHLLDDVSEWQIYFYRGNAWTNAQSSGDIAQAPAAAAGGAQPHEVLPDGIRLVVTTGGKVLTRDLALAPHGT